MTKAFLAEHLPLPKRVRQQWIGSLEEWSEEVPELQVLIEGTEQPILRPKDKEQRRRSDSGKNQRCTVKTQGVQEEPTGWLLDVEGGVCWQSARQAHVRGVWCSGKGVSACSGLGGQGVCWVRGRGA